MRERCLDFQSLIFARRFGAQNAAILFTSFPLSSSSTTTARLCRQAVITIAITGSAQKCSLPDDRPMAGDDARFIFRHYHYFSAYCTQDTEIAMARYYTGLMNSIPISRRAGVRRFSACKALACAKVPLVPPPRRRIDASCSFLSAITSAVPFHELFHCWPKLRVIHFTHARASPTMPKMPTAETGHVDEMMPSRRRRHSR